MVLDDDEKKYGDDLTNDDAENNEVDDDVNDGVDADNQGQNNNIENGQEQIQGNQHSQLAEEAKNYAKNKASEAKENAKQKIKNKVQNTIKKHIDKKQNKDQDQNENERNSNQSLDNNRRKSSKTKKAQRQNKKIKNSTKSVDKNGKRSSKFTSQKQGRKVKKSTMSANKNGKKAIKSARGTTKKAAKATKSATKTATKTGTNVAKSTTKTAGRVGKQAVKSTARTAKTAAKTAKTATKTAANAAKTTAKAAKTTVKAAQTTAKVAAKTAQVTVKATQAAIKAAIAAAKAAIAAAQAAAQAAAAAAQAVASFLAAIGPIGWLIIIIIILIVLLVGFIWSIFNSASDEMSDVTESLSDGFTATSTLSEKVMGKGINITDETLEAFVTEIEAMGISMDDLFLSGDIDDEKAKDDPANIAERNKFLRKFLLASLVTQYPDYGITEDETHYNGIIKVRRASNTDSLDNARDLEYVTLDVLDAMIDAVNSGMVPDVLLASYPTTSLEVRIDSTRDGMPIPAVIYLPEGEKDVPLVLMCHGFTGKKEGDNDHFLQLGEMLAQNGIAAITIDFSGCGDSGDPSENYTLDNMEKDMDAAIEFMEDRYSIDETKVGIVGHSMGGRVATEYLENVQAAALWAPADGDGLAGLEFLNDYEGLYETAKKEGSVDSGWDCNGKDFILSRDFFDDMSISYPTAHLSRFTGPLLVAFGDNDDVITEARDSIQSAMPPQGMFKTYNQDHNFTMENDDEHQLLVDTANLFTQAFFGRDANDGGEEVENPIAGQSIDDIRNDLQNVYSVDNNGNLYFASISSVANTTLDGDGNEVTTTTYTANKMAISYKKTVEKYAFPMEVSVALCLITQNPEYVADLIDKHVLSGEIEITILDTQRIDTHASWYDWTLTTTITERRHDGSDPTSTTTTTDINNYNYSKTVNTTVSSIAAMTDVDTWMAKSSVDYTNTPNQVEYPLGQETVVEEAECPVHYLSPQTVTLPVEINGNTVDCDYTTTRQVSNCTSTETQKIEFNEWEKGTVFVDTDAISDKADSILQQWTTVYKIPNTTTYEAPADNLEAGKQMLLELLNKEKTQQQVEIFEFLYNRAEDSDYSISNLDTSLYNDMELVVLGGEDDIVVDTTRSSPELVLSKEDIQSAISSCYSGNVATNLLNTLDAIYEVQETNHVNAIFTIAVAVQESSAGTNWDLIDPSTHNWMSLTGSGYVDRNGTSWKSYIDFSAATRDFGDLIANRGPYFSSGNYTVSTIGQKYCVPPDGWISGIKSIMKKLYSAVGVDLDAIIEQEGSTTGTGGATGNLNNDSGTGYWGTYTSSAGKTYKLYYQNYLGGNTNWGIDSNSMCVATAYAIMHSASGGGDPTTFWNSSVGAVNGGLTSISRDQGAILQYLRSGNPVLVYSNYGDDFYGAPHALALLDADSAGNVFVVNPYYISDGAGGQKKGGWYSLSTILSYPAASTHSFGSCGVLLN